MNSRTAVFKPLALAALLVMSAGAQATVTMYTTQASFLAAISAPGTDTFDAEPAGGPIFPYIGTAGPYGYTADAQADGIYILAPSADHWLSANSPGEYVWFYDMPANIRGLGAQFFATDFNGNVLPGLTVQFAVYDGVSVTNFSLVNSNAGSFVGFVSDLGIVEAYALAVAPVGTDAFTTVNNLTLGVAAAVPEPATYGLMLGGLALLAARVRRRA